MKSNPAVRLFLCLVAVGALAGCGKTAVAPVVVIDSALMQAPADDARLDVAKQEQEQRDAATDQPETGRVPGTGNERPIKER